MYKYKCVYACESARVCESDYESILKIRGTKFIFTYWHSNRQRNTSSLSHRRTAWSQPLVRSRNSQGSLWTAAWGWEPPLSHPSPYHLVLAQWSGLHEAFFLSKAASTALSQQSLGNWYHLGVQHCFEKVGRVMVIMNCLHQIFCFPPLRVYKKLWFPFKENRNEESGFA